MKLIFEEATAALSYETDNEVTGWAGSWRDENPPMAKRREVQICKDNKWMRTVCKENLNMIYITKEQNVTSVVKYLAKYLMNEKVLQP